MAGVIFDGALGDDDAIIRAGDLGEIAVGVVGNDPQIIGAAQFQGIEFGGLGVAATAVEITERNEIVFASEVSFCPMHDGIESANFGDGALGLGVDVDENETEVAVNAFEMSEERFALESVFDVGIKFRSSEELKMIFAKNEGVLFL